ncbi:MAG: hypothetical protein IKT31_05840 [Firmicutes bacterium]|nr:hypothetical protein [Bacillota bacterium]
MIESDTIKLLRECDAGIKMGVKSIDDVLPYVKSSKMKEALEECKRRHEHLGREVEAALNRFHDEGKEPNLMAEVMSWMKTSVKMTMDNSDETIADLMTDGCNMGVKSLNRYINEYAAADEDSKDIARRLVTLEDNLAKEIKHYL